MTTSTPTLAEATWALLDYPLDAIFDHGPGITTRQYHALRRFLSGPKGDRIPTMGDLLGMDIEGQIAEGPRPYSVYDPTATPQDAARWALYHYRDGLRDVYGLSGISAHEIRAAVLSWWDEARAELGSTDNADPDTSTP